MHLPGERSLLDRKGSGVPRNARSLSLSLSHTHTHTLPLACMSWIRPLRVANIAASPTSSAGRIHQSKPDHRRYRLRPTVASAICTSHCAAEYPIEICAVGSVIFRNTPRIFENVSESVALVKMSAIMNLVPSEVTDDQQLLNHMGMNLKQVL